MSDVTAELRRNLCTVERIRALQLPGRIDSLQTVLRFLNDPEADVEDPAALLQAFAHSTAASKPWLVDNQYQALQNSGNVRLLRKLQPDLVLSDDADLARTIEAIRARRPELLALARNEAAVATGRWYALARLSKDLGDKVRELASWDQATRPLEEYLVECRQPRSMSF